MDSRDRMVLIAMICKILFNVRFGFLQAYLIFDTFGFAFAVGWHIAFDAESFGWCIAMQTLTVLFVSAGLGCTLKSNVNNATPKNKNNQGNENTSETTQT